MTSVFPKPASSGRSRSIAAGVGSDTGEAAPSGPQLLRSLNLLDASMLVIGCIVGVGIFRTSSAIAGHLPSPAWMLFVWALGGLLSVCGALCYAELAAMFPATGGDYVYITKTYGKFAGFLFGWTKLFIERTATIAVLGMVFAEYLSRVMPLEAGQLRWVAAGAIFLLTLVNVRGVRWGTHVQNVLTALKIAALLSIIAAGAAALIGGRPVPAWPTLALTLPNVQALGVALVFVIWTYGGWTEAAYVAEEVKNPTRNVPRAIIGGVLATTALYLLVNLGYLVLLPVGTIAETPQVASAAMQQTWGNFGGTFIACMIAFSAFGALNGYVLTGARILYAMAKDHELFRWFGAVDPRTRTPAEALWTVSALSILLVWSKTFDQLVTYSTVVISVFFIMAIVSVMVLRRTQPDRSRPYRTWGYPYTPIIFIVTMIGFVANICLKEPADAGFGFLLLGMGIPLYWWSNAARICSVTRQRNER